jgi:ferritin
MLATDLLDALNRRLTNEFAASQLYLSFAAYFEEQNLQGFGHWMRVQSMEEHMHGLRLFDLILSRGGKVRLEAVPAPPAAFASPLDAAEQALAREETVSRDFNELYQMAQRDRDSTTETQLQWFLTEQVEEEQLLGHLVSQLKLANGEGPAMLLLDRELGGRQPGRATREAFSTAAAPAS